MELATPKWKTEPILRPEKIEKNNLKTNTRDLKSSYSEMEKFSLTKNNFLISQVLQNYLDGVYKGP